MSNNGKVIPIAPASAEQRAAEEFQRALAGEADLNNAVEMITDSVRSEGYWLAHQATIKQAKRRARRREVAYWVILIASLTIAVWAIVGPR